MADDRLFKALLATAEPADLGPGPRVGVWPEPELKRELETLFSKAELVGRRSELVRALMLLWHDYLDEAHTIAQSIDTADGAFVHGIMHRREPDYANAAYWFRRVGQHPAFAQLARRASALLERATEPDLAVQLIPGDEWDALAFIQACEEAARQPRAVKRVSLLREIQRAETEALLMWLCGSV